MYNIQMVLITNFLKNLLNLLKKYLIHSFCKQSVSIEVLKQSHFNEKY